MSDNAYSEAVEKLRRSHLAAIETLREAAAPFQGVEMFAPIINLIDEMEAIHEEMTEKALELAQEANDLEQERNKYENAIEDAREKLDGLETDIDSSLDDLKNIIDEEHANEIEEYIDAIRARLWDINDAYDSLRV